MKSKLSFNPSAALVHLRQCDPTLAALIKRIGPFTLKRTPLSSLFEAILRSIVYQQLHGKAAATIHARVMVALAPSGGVTPTALAKTTDAALRSAGLSRNKLRAIRDLAAQCQAGVVPSLWLARTLTDDELVTRLTSIHGPMYCRLEISPFVSVFKNYIKSVSRLPRRRSASKRGSGNPIAQSRAGISGAHSTPNKLTTQPT